MGLFAGAALSIGSKLLGGIGKRRASKKQKKANQQARVVAYENIEKNKQQFAETERRAGRDVQQIEGSARAITGASGFARGGQNADSVLGSLMSENKKQLDWLKLSNDSQLDSMKKEADLGYQVGKIQSDTTMWGGIGQLAGAAGAYNRLFPKAWGK